MMSGGIGRGEKGHRCTQCSTSAVNFAQISASQPQAHAGTAAVLPLAFDGTAEAAACCCFSARMTSSRCFNAARFCSSSCSCRSRSCCCRVASCCACCCACHCFCCFHCSTRCFCTCRTSLSSWSCPACCSCASIVVAKCVADQQSPMLELVQGLQLTMYGTNIMCHVVPGKQLLC